MDQRTLTTLNYFQDQQQSRQWKPFLTALGSLLARQMPNRDLRAFMRALGKDMALGLPLPACETLDELENSMNAVWVDLHWGWVSLEERDNCISIAHTAAPIVAAFGDGAQAWTPALLEGLYAMWFDAFGAGDPLIVSQVNQGREQGAGQLLEYKLGHPGIFE